MSHITRLLGTKRFLPIFVTQTLGAFNDNLYKIAMLTLITYDLSKQMELDAAILNPLAAAIFILPFALFSALSGQLADKYEKSRQVRFIKIAEVLIMLVGASALYTSSINLMFLTLFLLGTQSAFFGPIKYAILPQHLKKEELIAGNALVETSTFVSILLGNIIGGLLVRSDDGVFWTTALTLIAALCGVVSAFNIPKTERADPDLKINKNIFTSTWHLVSRLFANKEVVPIVILISWFWLYGSLFLAQFPSYTEAIVGGDESVLTFFITCFSVGIGVGSLLCSKLLKGEVTLRLVPISSLLISLFTVDLYLVGEGIIAVRTDGLITLDQFLSVSSNWRLIVDMFGIAVASGLFIVPLYTSLQTVSFKQELSRMVAANNVVNTAFMVFSSILAIAVLSLGFGINDVFLVGAALNLLPMIYLVRKGIEGDILNKILRKFS